MNDWYYVCALPVPAVSAPPPAALSHVSAAPHLLQETPVLLSWQFSAWLTGPFLTFCGPQSAPPKTSAAFEAAAEFPWASPHTEPSVCHLDGGKVGIINYWHKEYISVIKGKITFKYVQFSASSGITLHIIHIFIFRIFALKLEEKQHGLYNDINNY